MNKTKSNARMEFVRQVLLGAYFYAPCTRALEQLWMCRSVAGSGAPPPEYHILKTKQLKKLVFPNAWHASLINLPTSDSIVSLRVPIKTRWALLIPRDPVRWAGRAQRGLPGALPEERPGVRLPRWRARAGASWGAGTRHHRPI